MSLTMQPYLDVHDAAALPAPSLDAAPLDAETLAVPLDRVPLDATGAFVSVPPRAPTAADVAGQLVAEMDAAASARRASRRALGKRSDRQEKADALVACGAVQAEGRGVFMVRGRCDYVVRLDPPSCTCPDWCRRRRQPDGEPEPCKHQIAARLYADVATMRPPRAGRKGAPPGRGGRP
jgi:hypothetical protein